MSFQLSTSIIKILCDVRDHKMSVIEAFELISENFSEEMDEINEENIEEK